VRTGAWLLIGIASALVILTLLLVFIIPSDRRRTSGFTPRHSTMPGSKIPSGSPAGSLIKGFSYLYAPLRYQRIHHSVGGRLGYAIARIDAVDPSVAPERVGQALQQMVDLVSGPGDESPEQNGEPVVDDQPRSEEP